MEKENYEIIKQTKYLIFAKLNRLPNKKTENIAIVSVSSGYLLGNIRWFGHWRQYSFFPLPKTIWNTGCLEDINDVIKTLNKEHKEKR